MELSDQVSRPCLLQLLSGGSCSRSLDMQRYNCSRSLHLQLPQHCTTCRRLMDDCAGHSCGECGSLVGEGSGWGSQVRERWCCRMEELESLRRETARDCASSGVPLPLPFECSGSANITCTCHTLSSGCRTYAIHTLRSCSAALAAYAIYVVSKFGGCLKDVIVLMYACEG